MSAKKDEPGRRKPASRYRRGARRERSRRGLVVAVSVGVVLSGLIVAGNWVLHLPLFRVQHVVVTGNVHESTAEIEAAIGATTKPVMLNYSTSYAEQLLRQFPWIAHATVSKHWPNTLDVAVRETHVVGVTKWGAAWVYVSADGTNVGVAPATANVPTISYGGAQTPWPYSTLAADAVTVAAHLPPAFAVQVRQVRESADGVVSLQMTTPVTFVLGAATQLGPKFVAIASVIKNATLVAGDVVNVEVPTELSVSGPKAG